MNIGLYFVLVLKFPHPFLIFIIYQFLFPDGYLSYVLVYLPYALLSSILLSLLIQHIIVERGLPYLVYIFLLILFHLLQHFPVVLLMLFLHSVEGLLVHFVYLYFDFYPFLLVVPPHVFVEAVKGFLYLGHQIVPVHKSEFHPNILYNKLYHVIITFNNKYHKNNNKPMQQANTTIPIMTRINVFLLPFFCSSFAQLKCLFDAYTFYFVLSKLCSIMSSF